MPGETVTEITVETPAPAPVESPAPAPAVADAVAVIGAAADVLKVDETKTEVQILQDLVRELSFKVDGVFDLLRAVQSQGEAILAAQISNLQAESHTQDAVEEVEEKLEEVEIQAPPPPPPAPPAEPEARRTKKRGFF